MRCLCFVVVTLLLALLLYATRPAVAAAEPADNSSAYFTIPRYCDDRETLAGLVNAESGAQPYHVQVAVAQIFVNYAEQHQSTVCWMARFTNFSSVPAYVRKLPASYQARRFYYPPEELLMLADDVLHHRLPDETNGMMHFKGSADGMRILFRP